MRKDKRRTKVNYDELEKSVVNFDEIVPLETLMIHQSDRIIKPIIGNKIIEIIPQTSFNKHKLPFQAWKTDKLRDICKTNLQMMENYLLVMYSLMEQYFSKNDDENLLNLLNYFESIIQDKEIANNIINTSFVTMLISILKSKNDSIKIRSCSIIAFLIRYSTVIEGPLDDLGLTKSLETLVKERNIEVVRKAVATLGEYLFFVATQAEGEEVNSNYWKISKESLTALAFALEQNKDEITTFYAIKAIENITALTQIAKFYFANDANFIFIMLDVYSKTKNQDLKISLIYTVSHIIRLNTDLLKYFLERLSLNDLIKICQEENSKIQQGFLNCILYGLTSKSNKINKLKDFLDFLKYLINSLDQSNLIIKMKVLLILALTFEDPNAIIHAGDKFFERLNRMKKEQTSEIQMSIKIFETRILASIKIMIKNFIITLSKSSNKLSSRTKNTSVNDDLYSYLKAFSCLGIFTKISISLYSTEVLEALLRILENSDLYNEAILNCTLNNLKNFSENLNAVGKNNDIVIGTMLPIVIRTSFKYFFNF